MTDWTYMSHGTNILFNIILFKLSESSPSWVLNVTEILESLRSTKYYPNRRNSCKHRWMFHRWPHWHKSGRTKHIELKHIQQVQTLNVRSATMEPRILAQWKTMRLVWLTTWPARIKLVQMATSHSADGLVRADVCSDMTRSLPPMWEKLKNVEMVIHKTNRLCQQPSTW